MALFCLTGDCDAAIAAGEPAVSITTDFAAPTLQERDGWVRVDMEGCTPSIYPGEPVMPFRTFRLLLPPGHRVLRVDARPIGPRVSIPLEHPVEFGRQPVSSVPSPVGAMSSNAEASEEAPDPAIYSSASPFPDGPVRWVSRQRMADYDVAIVRLYPLSYLPATSELVFGAKWTVELELAAEPAAPAVLRTLSNSREAARSRVGAFVDNPEVLATYESPRPLRLQGMVNSIDDLIITRSNLVSAFQPLADYKVSQGLKDHVETVESISKTYEGVDLPERIRNFIRDAYARWGVSHVLLGGDTSVVPCRYAYASMNRPEKDSLIPCDLYYACLDGSWNFDGDNHWGEPVDGEDGGDVDLLAEVFVGRAPVETVDEATVFVEKTLRYGTLGHPQANQVLLVAEFLKEAPTGPAQGGDMFDSLLPLLSNFQVNWLDDRPAKTPQWTKAELQEALDGAPHLALFNGHGNDNVLMSSHLIPSRGLKIADVAALTNTWPFFAYSVGCNIGQFDNDKWSPDSIGEELVKQSERGAFAAVFNSRLGWYDPEAEWRYSGEFQSHFFERVLADGATTLGEGNQASKHSMIGQVEVTGLMTYRWCYYEITLFGDPRLTLAAPLVSSEGDADGDGMSDDRERVAGTDPADPASVLAVVMTSSPSSVEGLRLRWASVADRLYTVQCAADPAGPYESIAEGLNATPPLNTFTIGTASGQSQKARFYRVEARAKP